MEKTACLVSIKTAFEEEEKRYEGTFELSEERIRVSWMQPEENQGEGDTKFLLSYRVAEKLLRLTRKGSTEMELTFREGEITDGIMTTSHGDFDISIETFGQAVRHLLDTGEYYGVKFIDAQYAELFDYDLLANARIFRSQANISCKVFEL